MKCEWRRLDFVFSPSYKVHGFSCSVVYVTGAQPLFSTLTESPLPLGIYDICVAPLWEVIINEFERNKGGILSLCGLCWPRNRSICILSNGSVMNYHSLVRDGG